jgi:hypothetical protein
MSRWRRRSVGALALPLAGPTLGHAATAEEALTKAIRGILAPGEGQVSEAICAAPGGHHRSRICL